MEIYWIILHFSCIQSYYSSIYFPCAFLWELSLYVDLFHVFLLRIRDIYFHMISECKFVQVLHILGAICSLYQSASYLIFLSEEELVLSLQYFLLVLFFEVVESIFLSASTYQYGFLFGYDPESLQLSWMEIWNWHSIAQ